MADIKMILDGNVTEVAENSVTAMEECGWKVLKAKARAKADTGAMDQSVNPSAVGAQAGSLRPGGSASNG